MVNARRDYTHTCIISKTKHIYNTKQTEKLEAAKLTNAKLYWKMLKLIYLPARFARAFWGYFSINKLKH